MHIAISMMHCYFLFFWHDLWSDASFSCTKQNVADRWTARTIIQLHIFSTLSNTVLWGCYIYPQLHTWAVLTYIMYIYMYIQRVLCNSIYISLCKCIHKNIILSVTIVIFRMPKAQLKQVTPKAKPDDTPAPRPKGSRKLPARHANAHPQGWAKHQLDTGSIHSDHAWAAKAVSRHPVWKAAFGGFEQPTAICSTAADEPGQSLTPTGAHETCLDFVSHNNSTSIR